MATPLQTKQFQGDSVSGAQSLAMNSNFTAGSTAILVLTLFANGTSSVVSVTMGGTAATKDKAHGDGGNNFTEIWRAANVTGGSTTVTLTLAATGGQFYTAGVDEWASGIFDASPVDPSSGTATGAASTAPSATMSAAMAQANELSYAFFCDPVGTNWTSLTNPSGYTTTFVEFTGATHQAGGAAWKQLSAITTETATFTTGAAMTWDCAIQTYKISAGGPALSLPTPSGTISTGTTATIGCTTNTATGTFYCVVDSAANLTGVTVAQVKAGQKASGAAALASASSAVSNTTPSAGVTGLTAGTDYSYAIAQNDGTSDSSPVLTGTFKTAYPVSLAWLH